MGYLSQVFDTYYNSTNTKQKENLKKDFQEIIWNSLPYIKLNRFFKYEISYNNIKDKKALKIFEQYKYIEYKILKSRYDINELEKEDLIKARVNSNYGKYFDEEIYYKKEYYRALAEYRNIYFNYLKGETKDLQSKILENNNIVEDLKMESLKNKHDMKWNDYKLFINLCFDKIFDNYVPIDNKIKEGHFQPNHILDWDQDNYILGYVNKSLNGYLKNHIKELNGERKKKLYKTCNKCNKLIECKNNKQKYCSICAKEIKLEQTRGLARKNMKKLREERNVKKIENDSKPLI